MTIVFYSRQVAAKTIRTLLLLTSRILCASAESSWHGDSASRSKRASKVLEQLGCINQQDESELSRGSPNMSPPGEAPPLSTPSSSSPHWDSSTSPLSLLPIMRSACTCMIDVLYFNRGGYEQQELSEASFKQKCLDGHMQDLIQDLVLVRGGCG